MLFRRKIPENFFKVSDTEKMFKLNAVSRKNTIKSV